MWRRCLFLLWQNSNIYHHVYSLVALHVLSSLLRPLEVSSSNTGSTSRKYAKYLLRSWCNNGWQVNKRECILPRPTLSDSSEYLVLRGKYFIFCDLWDTIYQILLHWPNPFCSSCAAIFGGSLLEAKTLKNLIFINPKTKPTLDCN